MPDNTPETQSLLPVTQASKAAIARGANIETTKDDYLMAERVIKNWCVKGDKRKTRQLIAEGVALARAEAADAAALLADANSHYSAGQLEEIALAALTPSPCPGDVGKAIEALRNVPKPHGDSSANYCSRFDAWFDHVETCLAALTPSALSGDNSQSSSNAGGVDEVIAAAAEVCGGGQASRHSVNRLRAALASLSTPTAEPMGEEALERWTDISDDPEAIVACGERWKKVAANVGCELHGFNDGHSASFITPDGHIIEVGPKFRRAIASLSTPTAEPMGELQRLGQEYDEDALDRLAVEVLHNYRKRDGLTCYNYDHNRQRDERYMRETFAELVAPFIAALTTPPTPDRIGKDAVREARGHVVTAIAFLNRDQHSDRINETVGHVVGVLAEADEVLRATPANR